MDIDELTADAELRSHMSSCFFLGFFFLYFQIAENYVCIKGINYGLDIEKLFSRYFLGEIAIIVALALLELRIAARQSE